jgi:hypothetical protein
MSTGYVRSESSGQSPDTGNNTTDSSTKLTPVSSGATGSWETSPREAGGVVGNRRNNTSKAEHVGGTTGILYFGGSPDYRGITANREPSNSSASETTPATNSASGAGVTPRDGEADGVFEIPQTPGGSFNWESIGNGVGMGTGMTPVGEGVLRELMGMGPLEMGWDGGS